MSDSIILLGVLGYLGAMFKNNIRSLFNYFTKKYTSYIIVNDNDEITFIYNNAIKYIKTLNNPIIENNIQLKGIFNEDSGKFEIIEQISPSLYIHKLGRFTWCTIHISKEKFNIREMNVVSFKIIGKNHAEYKNEIQKNIQEFYDKRLYITSHNNRTPLSKKSFNDLFIENKENIISCIQKWKELKPYYNKHNITYKMGILLHGQPGTGKSSFIITLANYMKYDVITIKADELLTGGPHFLNRLRQKTVCVLEDVDCMFDSSINRTKDGSANKALNELLQLLDGLSSPSNVLFVLTTNHKDRLDPAIYRPGRVDLDICLDNISKELAYEMVKHFGLCDSLLDGETFPINPSYLQNKILQYVKIENINFEDEGLPSNVIPFHNSFSYTEHKSFESIAR